MLGVVERRSGISEPVDGPSFKLWEGRLESGTHEQRGRAGGINPSSPYTTIHVRDKQHCGREAKSYRAGNKSQRLNVLEDAAIDVGSELEGWHITGNELAIVNTNGHIDIIPETQLNGFSSARGKVYNDILASIGLDNPTSS